MGNPAKSQKLERDNIIVSDIEARDWVNFLVIGIYDGKIFKSFTDLSDYFNFIFLCRVKSIYFHFGGGYDFLFLIDFVFRNSEKYFIKEMLPRGSKFLSVTIGIKGTKRTIKLLDSSAFLPFSLRSLAENFNVETQKGEIEYEKITHVTPELISYLKGDCLALHQCISKYSENPLIASVGIKQTIASQAYQIFKKLYLKKEITRLPGGVDEFCRAAYAGGRTEIFRPLFDGPGKLNVYDVNSLYPFVMREFDYPIAFRYYTREFEPGTLGIYHCDVDVPAMDIPPLGINHNGKYIFPIGKFSGAWTTPELEMALKYGVKILKITKGAIFENGGPVFREYVDNIYTLRQKSGDNSADNIIYKLLLNSLYGRFALRLDREKIVVDHMGEGIRPMMSIKIGEKFVQLGYEDVTLKSETFSPLSIFVTSYARIHNYENYLSKYKVYYHDTDSFFMPEKLPHSKNLGDIKLEYQLDQACFLLPKTYLGVSDGKTKIKMKGFDKKKIKNFQFDDFLAALEGDLKRLKSTTPRRIAKFRESIRRNKKVLSILESSDKNIRSQYDKRLIYKKGRQYLSKPIFLNYEEI